MADRLTTFRNARARILWTEDGRWYSGWTKCLTHGAARIVLKSFVPFSAVSRVVGECCGDGTRVKFVGVVEGQTGQEIAVRICGSLTFEPSEESIRIGVAGVTGTLSGPDFYCDLLVTDVSPGSLGALTDQAIPAGSVLDLGVEIGTGVFNCPVKAVYCRTEPGLGEGYRVGLRLLDPTRLDAARWGRFIWEMTQI